VKITGWDAAITLACKNYALIVSLLTLIGFITGVISTLVELQFGDLGDL
jgi:hypothetical protein